MGTTRKARSVTAVAAAIATGLAIVGWNAPAATADDDPAVVVSETTIEYAANPLGLDVERPRLSWVLDSAERGQGQTAYRVLVASTADLLAAEKGDVWDSGRVESSQSHLVEYGGPAVEPRTRYHWRVMVWDSEGRPTTWSEPAWWETGLLDGEAFEASWIGHEIDEQLPTANTERDYPAELDEGSTLGQSFVADRPFTSVSGEFPTWSTSDSAVTLTLYRDGPGGEEIVSQRFDGVADNSWVELTFDAPVEPGVYYLEQSDLDGTVGWWSHSSDVYPHGTAFLDGEPVEGDRTIRWEPAVEEADGRSPQLRKDFTLDKAVASARLYASALGVYELSINGQRVGDHHLAPGWTDYDERVQYQTYDVTEHVVEGGNAIGATLGAGWYAGNLAIFGPDHYGSQPWLLAQLEVTYTDGSTEVITSDDSWHSSTGPVLYSDMLMGEIYDAQAETPGWTEPGFDDDMWAPVGVKDDVAAELVGQVDPPVRVTEEILPVEITEPEDGVYVVDLGQNMVGTVRLTVEGPRGTTVRMRHAEVLDSDGMVYTENLRTARATDYYTLAGDGTEVYEPYFTFHGFRYVELTGFPGEPDLDSVTGLVMHTDAPETSTFESSSPMLNKLFSNITWGQRGNFLSIPTDTPARDERMGWTGDINVFVGAATYNMNVATFLGKWLQDLRDAQFDNGAFTDVAPIIGFLGGGSAGWGDAGVTVPWTLWQRYGDTRLLEEHYAAMENWVEYLVEDSSNHLRPPEGYGDWLNVDDETPKDVIATAYYAHSVALLSEMAAALGKDGDAVGYAELAEEVRGAFNDAYVGVDGRVQGDTQTAYVLALSFDLLPDELRAAAAERLVELIEERDWHLSTGFLGTPDLLPVLTEHGHLDVAYRLINQDTYPSWGYQISKGATTMWEHWDSIRPDGSFQDPAMNSFNHYAYGAVGEWMLQVIAGIEQQSPGFEEILIRPRPGGSVEHASASYRSVLGDVATSWRDSDRGFELATTIPVNATAEVWVPAVSRDAVTEGGRPADSADGVTFDRMEDGYAVFRVGSGEYSFASDDVLGYLGLAEHAATGLSGEVSARYESGELTADQHSYLMDQTELLLSAVTAATDRYASADERGTVTEVHRALSVADRVLRWVSNQEASGELAPETSAALLEHVHDARRVLSNSSALLLGVHLAIEAEERGVAAGDAVEVVATVENTGSEQLQNVRMELEPPDGWSVVADGPDGTGVLAPGERFIARFEVSVPLSEAVGRNVAIDGTVGFTRTGGRAELARTVAVDVVSPVVIEALSAEPRIIDDPGSTATVTATIANRSESDVAGDVRAAAEDGWGLDPAEEDYELAPGESTDVTFTVTSPEELAATDVSVAVRYGEQVGATDSVRLTYSLASWLFETDGDAEGWEPTNQLSDFDVSGGVLHTTSSGGDPFMVNSDELSIDASEGLTVEIVMETSVDSGAQVFWTSDSEPSFSEGKSTKFTVEAGGMRTYQVPVYSFDGALTGLRIDPLEREGDIAIESIRIVR